MTKERGVIVSNESMVIENGKSWFEERLLLKEHKIKLYQWLIVGLSLLLCAITIGLTAVVTKETVQPYLAIINNKTGEVSTPKKLDEQNVIKNWSVIRHFIRLYVNDRESYNFLNINAPYKNVMRMSSPTIQNQIDDYIRPEKNQKSPIKVLARDKYMTVDIHSISKLENPNLIDVRITSHVYTVSNNQFLYKNEWRIILKWKLVNFSQDIKDWDSNPIGFNVVYYDKQPVV